jgi:hypothetical protein
MYWPKYMSSGAKRCIGWSPSNSQLQPTEPKDVHVHEDENEVGDGFRTERYIVPFMM